MDEGEVGGHGPSCFTTTLLYDHSTLSEALYTCGNYYSQSMTGMKLKQQVFFKNSDDNIQCNVHT